ncbi:Hypothetical protein CINCED_3A001880 [Cinara cedri]|uniref:Uncharacterized protein n=1 Tax=Cinara cedri TaxID=506608 RepID=A0A5E4M0D9_9HEMI|nr:Hypothetical protein CINCED_3A001880 [Cinara cedri]
MVSARILISMVVIISLAQFIYCQGTPPKPKTSPVKSTTPVKAAAAPKVTTPPLVEKKPSAKAAEEKTGAKPEENTQEKVEEEEEEEEAGLEPNSLVPEEKPGVIKRIWNYISFWNPFKIIINPFITVYRMIRGSRADKNKMEPEEYVPKFSSKKRP